MRLLIVNGPRDPRCPAYQSYRGTYRAHPTYCDGVPKDHELNKMFFWFLEEGGELGLVHDLTKAMRYVELLNTHLSHFSPPYTHFEVVEVTDGNTRPESNGNFIGFDLSAGYNNSLLSSGLKQFSGVNQLAEPIRELCDLMSRHYAPQLNAQGLFQTFEVASLCLRSMIALQDLSPSLFEGGDLREFRPVGLYTVYCGSET
jgi:hypothetical protein